jgi:hypothetical protein
MKKVLELLMVICLTAAIGAQKVSAVALVVWRILVTQGYQVLYKEVKAHFPCFFDWVIISGTSCPPKGVLLWENGVPFLVFFFIS